MASKPRSKSSVCAVACEHCGGGSVSPEGGVLRCVCGSLIARYVESGIELKCRRCKRTIIVPCEAPERGG